MTETLLAFDLGTTGCKAALVDARDGRVIGSASAAYSTRYGDDGSAEQEPSDWEQAAIQTSAILAQAQPQAWAQIEAIGCSGQMNGVVLVDKRGKALRPAIIHADTRAARLTRQWEVGVGADAIFQATGNRADPHLTLPKVACLMASKPSVMAQAAFIVQAKDYLTSWLTGTAGVTDPSDASLTGGFDVSQRRWANSLWEDAGVPLRLLPRVVPSSTIIGTVTETASQLTHLRAGTPVVAGGGDGACATAGAGVAMGESYNYLGGTAWVGVRARQKVADARLSHYCGLDDTLTVFGTTQCAGSSVEWLANVLHGPNESASPAAWDSEAAQVPPGARNLFFLPYLQGERSPLWDAHARGVFFGLSTHHGRPELFRAGLEGVGYALRSVLDVFADNGWGLPQLRLLGGGASSPLWRSILGGIYNRRLLTVSDVSAATSLGAAMAAGVGVGLLSSWDAGRAWVTFAHDETPSAALVNAYAPRYAFYRTLYPALQDRFAALADLETRG